MSREKNFSKYFYDDEIEYVEQDGTIHLKMGVMRMPQYRFSVDREEETSYYNNFVSYRDKIERRKRDMEEENDWG
jgi:hypothetical protein